MEAWFALFGILLLAIELVVRYRRGQREIRNFRAIDQGRKHW